MSDKSKEISNVNRFFEARRRIIDSEFSNLNDMQRRAVYANDGPVLILAGAGSGKTTTIISKIGYLIKYGNSYNSTNIPEDLSDSDIDFLEEAEKNETLKRDPRYIRLMSENCIPAENLLAITFTNKAANEMKERLQAKYNISSGQLWALTFHSTCVRILRMYADLLDYNRNFTIYDDLDSQKLIDSIIKKKNLSKDYSPKLIARLISKAKTSLLNCETYTHNGEFPQLPEIYMQYTKELKAANAFDFDDLLRYTVKLLSENERVRKNLNNRFKYVLVDEYQDTNPLQYKLISLLSHDGRICVVGDDDQSIYRFMGASVENILDFEHHFEGTEIIRLEQNYRSTKNILDAANAVISNNVRRKGKNMWTTNDEGDKIVVCNLPTQYEESEFIVKSILTGVSTDNCSYNDFCVLYRTNAQSTSVEMALKGNGIPYKVFGGLPFFKRKEIQDILAYFNVINNPNDRTRLVRIINEPKRGIGETSIEKVIDVATSKGIPIFEVIKNARNYPELQRSAEKLMKFAAMIVEFQEKARTSTVSELFTYVVDTIEYEKMLMQTYQLTDSENRILNVRELYNNIVQYEKGADDPSLLGYLEDTALISAIDNLDENEAAVTLMTMHCAKGLEFDIVFLPGFEEGIFPSPQSLYEDGGLEEERRLCYVSLTRARKRLYIVSVSSRMIYGNPRPSVPSRFINEIPEEYIEHRDKKPLERLKRPEKKLADKMLFTGTVNILPQRENVYKSSFAVGDRVKHKVFGEGEILTVTAMSSDTLVEVKFDKVGIKKLMTNFAKLTKI